MAVIAVLAVRSSGPEPAAGPAPPASAMAEAPAGDSGGTATVGVYDDGLPVPERWVVFHDEAGAVRSTRRTGKDGKASGPMSARGMVTVAYGASIKHLVTVAGVEPGDQLVVGEEEDEGAPEEAVCMARVFLPAAPSRGARHVLTLGVGTTEVGNLREAHVTSVLERFVEGGRFAVLAEAFGRDGEPLAFAHTWATGCARDAGAAEVRLPSWSTDYRTFTLDVTGKDEEGTAVAGELFILGKETDRLRRGRREAPMRGHAVLRFTAPRPLGTHAAYELVSMRAGSNERSVLVDRRKSLPEHMAVDLRERLLPRVEGVRVEAAAGARPTVRWRATAPAKDADAVVLRVTWPETSEHVWNLVAPPDHPSSFAMPALPEELADWRPDARTLTAAVALVEASYVDGFADVKKRGLVALEDPPEEEDATLLRYSAAGDLRF